MLTDKFNKFFRLNFGANKCQVNYKQIDFLLYKKNKSQERESVFWMGYEEEEIMVWYSQVNNNNPLPHF